MNKGTRILLAILAIAFFGRLAGINYGLPLWLYDDEAAFPLAALKMIQLKTVLPAAHYEEFKSVLYYPPYISYSYLPFFLIYLSAKYIFYSGAQFMDYLGADLSGFFIIARFINILLGAISVYLVYGIAKNIFADRNDGEGERIGLAAAFLLATSLIHSALSMTARHWMPVSFVLILGFYFLTRPDWSFKRRYIFAGVLAGLGMGISSISGFLTILMILCAIFYDRKFISELAREKFLYAVVMVFVVLAIVPGWLYPGSYGYGVDVTSGDGKAISGLLYSPILFLRAGFSSEPILFILSVIGLMILWKKNRRISWIFIIFWITYSASFYLFFRYEHRFLLPLVPIMTVLGGYAFSDILRYFNDRQIWRYALVLVFLLPLAPFLKLSYLAYKNDSRILAREWIESNIPSGERVIVNARLTRISMLPDAVTSQENISVDSLRRIDVSERALGGNPFYPSYNALNLFTVTGDDFYADISNYIKKNKYAYLLLSLEDYQKNEALFGEWLRIAADSRELARFGFSDTENSLTRSYFGNVFDFLRVDTLGPPIGIYELR